VLQSEPVDVVISDWAMPGINGVELCRRIRADMRSETDYIYFIMVTGRTDRDDFCTCRRKPMTISRNRSHTPIYMCVSRSLNASIPYWRS
jgi:CheY-like chemotaxis protein